MHGPGKGNVFITANLERFIKDFIGCFDLLNSWGYEQVGSPGRFFQLKHEWCEL